MSKAIIFDVDGTLLDGTEGIIKSVQKAIKHFNLEMLSDAELLKFVGPPIQNSCKNAYRVDDEFAQEFANFFRKEYAAGDVFFANAYGGIYDLLEYLKNQSFKLGVATYKRQDYAIELMKHFGFDKYFTSICGADNENKLKKFDILQNCIKELNESRKNTILIGDSYHDGVAAKQMEIGFIGVTYGFGFKKDEDVEEFNPIFVARNVKEIKNKFMEEI